MRLKDENKKQAIYQSAMTLVTEQGLAGTSMSKIAKLAKVSPSTIYTYFDSKEDMLNKLYIMASEQSIAVINEIDTNEPFEFYQQWMMSLFKFMTANPVIFSFYEQSFNSPHLSDDARQTQQHNYQPLYKVFHQAIEQGKIRKMPIALARAIVIAPLYSLIWSHIRGEVEVTDKMLYQLTNDTWQLLQK